MLTVPQENDTLCSPDQHEPHLLNAEGSLLAYCRVVILFRGICKMRSRVAFTQYFTQVGR